MSNPVLKSTTFQGLGWAENRMTIAGTVNKTAILLALMLITAAWTWGQAFSGDMGAASRYMLVGVVGGLVLSLVTIFYQRASAFTAPAYALFEGLAIGGVSATFEARYPGIALQAALATFGTLAAMLVAYKSGALRMTDRMRSGILIATGAIAVIYLLDMILMLFHVPIGFIHESGPLGILFSVVVVGVAAFNLLVDFELIERGAAQGAPSYMEWYGAFALTVTLVWLYLEILRLMSKLRSR